MNDEENKEELGNKPNHAEKTNKQKKQRRKKRWIKAIPFIATLLIGLMVASCLMALVGIIGEAGQNIINSIVDFFKGSQTTIEIDDEQLDKLIEVIESTGIDLDDLELLRRDRL